MTMPSLRTLLLIAVFLLGVSWVVVFVLTGAPNLVLAVATMGAGIGLGALSLRDSNKTTNGDEGE